MYAAVSTQKKKKNTKVKIYNKEADKNLRERERESFSL